MQAANHFNLIKTIFYTFSLSLTDHMRADTSQLKQRGNQGMVDLSSFLFPSEWVDKHQKSEGAQRTWKTHLEY